MSFVISAYYGLRHFLTRPIVRHDFSARDSFIQSRPNTDNGHLNDCLSRYEQSAAFRGSKQRCLRVMCCEEHGKRNESGSARSRVRQGLAHSRPLHSHLILFESQVCFASSTRLALEAKRHSSCPKHHSAPFASHNCVFSSRSLPSVIIVARVPRNETQSKHKRDTAYLLYRISGGAGAH